MPLRWTCLRFLLPDIACDIEKFVSLQRMSVTNNYLKPETTLPQAEMLRTFLCLSRAYFYDNNNSKTQRL